MKNKLACPHCDKEITTLKMGYNAKQALVIIPILLLGFTPFFVTILNPSHLLPMIWKLPVLIPG
jgi:hypothetical protein